MLSASIHTESGKGFGAGLFSFLAASDVLLCSAISESLLGFKPTRVFISLGCRYHERMLECCVPLDNVRERGVTLEQFARIAACNTLQVRLVRAPNARAPADSVDALAGPETADEHEFRRVLKRCTAVDDRVLVCAYSRRVVGQTGIAITCGRYAALFDSHLNFRDCMCIQVEIIKVPRETKTINRVPPN